MSVFEIIGKVTVGGIFILLGCAIVAWFCSFVEKVGFYYKNVWRLEENIKRLERENKDLSAALNAQIEARK